MRGLPRREYTLDFKHDAVRRAAELGPCATARELGLPEQTLRNWIRAGREGRLDEAWRSGAGVTPDRMEQTRADAEQARQYRRQQLRSVIASASASRAAMPSAPPTSTSTASAPGVGASSPASPAPRTQALHSPSLPLPRLHRH
ncbi:transposase [Roseateles chitosanitabidus]|uniref:transposase n=1 Tax=Roseateles chitosanitabidus TaxID=65048 RepID=UPI0008315AC9